MKPLDKVFESIYEFAPGWRELVEVKRDYYIKQGLTPKVRNLSIEVHNATWCPDCVREVTDLMALVLLCKTPINLKLISYEDRETYKKEKKNGELSINCLPTIIFRKLDKEVYRVEEDSDGDLSTAFLL